MSRTLAMTEEQKIASIMNIGHGVTHTLEETAIHFGMTRQRVQQIEQSAFRKLRKAFKAKGITTAEQML